MTQSANAIGTLDLENAMVESTDLVFLDDASCEYVGGGDSYNGF